MAALNDYVRLVRDHPLDQYPGNPVGIVDRGGNRRKDRKRDYEWKDVETVYTVPSGAQKDWSLVWVKDPHDLAYLGFYMGHCAGTHWVWVVEEKTWYFFALLDTNGVPRDTVHCKWEKWKGKPHPRDPVGSGYGRGTDFPQDVEKALVTVRNDRSDPAVYSSGGYITLPQVEKAFKACGKEYEPGKYKATFLNSTYGVQSDGGSTSWDAVYGGYKLYAKPPGVEDDLWNQYNKVLQALKAEYDKKQGNKPVAGRVFNFDEKKLIVLSYNREYKPIYGDWLIDMNKRKKEPNG